MNVISKIVIVCGVLLPIVCTAPDNEQKRQRQEAFRRQQENIKKLKEQQQAAAKHEKKRGNLSYYAMGGVMCRNARPKSR